MRPLIPHLPQIMLSFCTNASPHHIDTGLTQFFVHRVRSQVQAAGPRHRAVINKCLIEYRQFAQWLEYAAIARQKACHIHQSLGAIRKFHFKSEVGERPHMFYMPGCDATNYFSGMMGLRVFICSHIQISLAQLACERNLTESPGHMRTASMISRE